jgi:hypothetical protein
VALYFWPAENAYFYEWFYATAKSYAKVIYVCGARNAEPSGGYKGIAGYDIL